MPGIKEIINQFIKDNSSLHDRILSARSNDGIKWQREKGIRMGKGIPSNHPMDMAYYCSVYSANAGDSPSFGMYYHSGIESTPGVWQTAIHFAKSNDGLHWENSKSPIIAHGDHPLCKKRVIAPHLVDFGKYKRLYFTGVAEDNIFRILSAVSTEDDSKWEIEEGARIDATQITDGLQTKITGVADSSIVSCADGRYRMYFSAIKEDFYHQEIRSAISVDGLSWQIEDGVRILPGQTGYRRIANNPSVIQVRNGWRMFFRGADTLPLWNNIYTAKSENGLDWQVETTALRFRRYARYERNGIGFPFVLQLADGTYRMYYTGYWGAFFDKSAIDYYKKVYEGKGF